MSDSEFRRLRSVGKLFGDTHNGTERPEMEPAERFRVAFMAAWPRLHTMLREERNQYVVAAVPMDGGESTYKALELEDGPFLPDASVRDTIIGRHPQCDIHLPHDEALSLRHFLLRVQRDAHGRISLRCLDLFTDSGLHDESGNPFRSVVTDGHLLFRAAGYVVFVISGRGRTLPSVAEEAWTGVRNIAQTASLASSVDLSVALKPRPRLQVVSEDADIPQFTKVEGVLTLGAVDLGSQNAIGAISLRGWDVDISVRVPARALARGILIGRYARCQLRTEDHGGFSELSRVHLLVLLDESGLWVIDTASSNGTAMNGRYFRSAILDDGALVELPGEITLRWQLN